MERKNALIPGASGIIGRTLIEYLSNLDDWNIRPPAKVILDR
jgi:hypothetical protein